MVLRWPRCLTAAGLAIALFACDNAPSLMVVELHTNLLPGVDFARARLRVRAADVPGAAELERERAYTPSDRDERTALRLAEIPGLAPGDYLIEVVLFDAAGGFVADRIQSSPFSGARAIPVIIDYQCEGIRCTDGLTCFGGRCVDPQCLPGAPPTGARCPEALCRTDDDCAAGLAECARGTCLGGVCFPEPDDARCADGQRCHVELGCIDVVTPVDGGGPIGDAGCVAAEACNGADDDCDGVSDEGFDLANDPANCGLCGARCADRCVGGACACTPGFADCDGLPANGCEADLASASSCGDCATACSGATPVCIMGSSGAECASACGALTMCTGSCVDLMTDRENCGSCRRACDPGETCVAGACRCGGTGADCPRGPGSACCGTQCLNVADDPAHCGGCGISCARPHRAATCAGGACVFGACDPGWADCDGVASNGCEADVSSDVTRCGDCTTSCGPYPNAVAGCAGGECVLDACVGARADCDGLISTGCEITVWGNDAHCGGCGVACTGGLVCNTTLCCAPRTLNCDGAAANGCECAYSNAFSTCAAGVCALGMCLSGFGNCDAVASNGCEEVLGSSLEHCGACGASCDERFPTIWAGARYDACNGGACQCGGAFACGDNSLCCRLPGGGSACRDAVGRNTAHCGACHAACDEAGGETCGVGTPPTGGTGGRCCCGTSCGAVGAGRYCPAGTTCNEIAGTCV